MKKLSEMRKETLQLITFVYIIASVLLTMLPDLLGLYDTMLGREGLRRTIAVILLKNTARLMLSLPIFIIGIRIVMGVIKNRKEMKRPVISGLSIGFLTVTIPLIVWSAFRSHYQEQEDILDIYGPFGETKLLMYCVSDLVSDDHEEYTINSVYADSRRNISSTGRGGASYHTEYLLSGYYYDDIDITTSAPFRFRAQVGSNDRRTIPNIVPYGAETVITVYSGSGFLRTVEPPADISPEDGFTFFYTLTCENGAVIRSEPHTKVETPNLTWYGFRKGEGGNINKAIFGINAENSAELNHFGLCDEVCLYAWIDGGYKPVSNTIYFYEE